MKGLNEMVPVGDRRAKYQLAAMVYGEDATPLALAAALGFDRNHDGSRTSPDAAIRSVRVLIGDVPDRHGVCRKLLRRYRAMQFDAALSALQSGYTLGSRQRRLSEDERAAERDYVLRYDGCTRLHADGTPRAVAA